MLPTGPPVTGDDFVDRENEIHRVEKALEEHSVLIVGPRRYGKTSILKTVRSRLWDDERKAVYADVEGVQEPAELLFHVVEALSELQEDGWRKSFQGWLSEGLGLGEVEVGAFGLDVRMDLREEIQEDWRTQAQDLATLIADAGELVIALDELPVAFEAMEAEEAQAILLWLRQLRQEADGLRMLFGGSLSFESKLPNWGGSKALNDVKRIRVHGFDRAGIEALINRWLSLTGFDPTEGFATTVANELGLPSCPYFAAALLGEVEELVEYQGCEFGPHLVPEAKQRLLGSQGKHYFDHYRTRLRQVYEGPRRRAAETILHETAQQEEITVDRARSIYQETAGGSEEAFHRLLSDLETDYYIVQSEGMLRFAEDLLREWWAVYGPR